MEGEHQVRNVRLGNFGISLRSNQSHPALHSGEESSYSLYVLSHERGPLPQLPWDLTKLTENGSLPTDESGRYRAALFSGSRSLELFDRQRREAFYVADEWPYWDKAAPFRNIFQWMAQEGGHSLVHAACVEGVLLVGKGGSGKSTTAFRAWKEGMTLLGDDYCFLEKKLHVHSLYRSVKLSRDCGFALDDEIDRGAEKAAGFLSLSHSSFPLKAICIPRIGPKTFLEVCSPKEALCALAPSTLFQLAASQSSAFSLLSQAVLSVPTYILHVGKMSATPILKELAL